MNEIEKLLAVANHDDWTCIEYCIVNVYHNGGKITAEDAANELVAYRARIAKLEAALEMCKGLAIGIGAMATTNTINTDANAIAQTIRAVLAGDK